VRGALGTRLLSTTNESLLSLMPRCYGCNASVGVEFVLSVLGRAEKKKFEFSGSESGHTSRVG